MKNLKKILGVLFFVVVIIFASCSGEKAASGATETTEKIKITAAFEAGRMAEAALSIVPAFNTLYPDIEVEIVALPYDSMGDKIMNDVSSGAGAYDVLSLFTGNSQILIKNDWLLPLDDFIKDAGIDTSDFVKSTMDIATLLGRAETVNSKGKIWGLPFSSDIMMLVYRKDLYEKHGISVPRTQDEMLNVARKLNGIEGNIKGMILTGLDSAGSQVFHDYICINLNTNAGTLVTADAKPNILNDGNKKAMNLFKTYYDEGLVPSGSLEYNYSEKNNAFAQGLGANMFQWMLACVNDIDNPANSKVAGKVGYAPVPGGVGSGSGWIVSVSKATKHPHEAMTFINYLTSYDSVKKAVMEFGQGPVRKSVILSDAFIEKYPFAPTLVEALDGGMNQRLIVPGLPLWPKIQAEINKAVMAYVTGKNTLDNTMQSLDSFLSSELKAVGY